MTLWLVRHAQPLIEPGLCYGQLDVAADAIATQRTADALAPLLPVGAKLYSSVLLRAQQLTQALCARRSDLSCEFDQRLNEMDFGVWEGIAWRAIPKTAFDAWTADFDTHRFGGAQSLRELLTRVGQFLNEINIQQDVIWITHAGVIRAVNYLLQYGTTAVATAEKWPTDTPSFGAWQEIELDLLSPFFCRNHP
jgi:alpha-ribazole phosphatase